MCYSLRCASDCFSLTQYECFRTQWYENCLSCVFSAVVSGCSHGPAGGATNRSERQCVRARADHFWVQQSSHQPLCVITVAPVDQAAQCSPSPGEGIGGHCEGMEELHREGRRETYLLVITCSGTNYVCHKDTTMCKSAEQMHSHSLQKQLVFRWQLVA